MSALQNVDEKQCEGPCYATVIDKNPPCPLQCGSQGCKSFKDGPKVDLRDHVFVWLYGGPSAGKTTICKQLCSKYGLTRVHVGELLQQEVASGSVKSKCVQNVMDRGELAPNDLVIKLLKREIETKAKGTKGFVIDGFPREKRQGVLFESIIAPATAFIFLDAEKKTLLERHEARAKVTQKRWPTVKRNDNCVAGKLQVHLFFENHKKIVEQYPHKVVRINAEKRSTGDMFSEIVKFMDRAVARLKQTADRRKAEDAKWEALDPKPKPIVPL